MALYAIADTHLSFGTNKPMDTFEGWNNYTEKLEKNWNKLVTDDDLVVIVGDISWAMNFEELKPDFDFINKLNGKKIIIKGNHDYWWNTKTKMNKFLQENGFDTIKILHNDSFEYNGVSVCGSRGWLIDCQSEQDIKVFNREINRVKTSIESATCDEKIVFLHYPPITTNYVCEEIVNLLHENGIKKCYYGHLHGVAAKYSVDGMIENINFKLVSCDKLNFTPYLILK